MQEAWEMQVWSLSREDPLEECIATHSSILARGTPWTEELVGYSPWGHRVGPDWSDWAGTQGLEDAHSRAGSKEREASGEALRPGLNQLTKRTLVCSFSKDDTLECWEDTRRKNSQGGTWRLLWTEWYPLPHPNSHVEVITLSTSERGCVWTQGL